MVAVWHIVDSSTPRDCLRTLELLAGPDEQIISLGREPDFAPLAGRMRKMPRPRGLAWLSKLQMRDLVNQAPKDLRIIHAWSASPAIAGMILARGTDAKVLLTLPYLPPGEPAGFGTLWRIWPNVRKGRLSLIVPTERAWDKILDAAVPQERVHVLPPAAAPVDQASRKRQAVREALGLNDSHKVMLALGEMTRYSGHQNACWAFAIVRRLKDNLRLLLPGAGPHERHVRAFAETLDFDEDLFLTGDRFGLDEMLAAADVATFLCESDCGVTDLSAAMAAVLPIVASRMPDVTECAANGRAAMLVKPREPRLASAAVLKLLEDGDSAFRLGQTAKKWATGHLDAAACRKRLDQIYEA